jgi:hypothetical protein
VFLTKAGTMKRLHTEEEESKVMAHLNVRGAKMWIYTNTVQKNYPESVLAGLLCGKDGIAKRDEDGSIYIDSEPHLFSQILHCIERELPFTPSPPPPIMITKEAWLKELLHFGLIQEDDYMEKPKKKKKKKKTEFDRIMKEKKRIAQERVEMVVLRLPSLCPCANTIENGASALNYYIPKGVYEMPWKQDLYDYLLDSQNYINKFFSDRNHFKSASIVKVKQPLQKQITYTFDKVNYTSNDHQTIHFQLYRESLF